MDERKNPPTNEKSKPRPTEEDRRLWKTFCEEYRSAEGPAAKQKIIDQYTEKYYVDRYLNEFKKIVTDPVLTDDAVLARGGVVRSRIDTETGQVLHATSKAIGSMEMEALPIWDEKGNLKKEFKEATTLYNEHGIRIQDRYNKPDAKEGYAIRADVTLRDQIKLESVASSAASNLAIPISEHLTELLNEMGNQPQLLEDPNHQSDRTAIRELIVQVQDKLPKISLNKLKVELSIHPSGPSQPNTIDPAVINAIDTKLLQTAEHTKVMQAIEAHNLKTIEEMKAKEGPHKNEEKNVSSHFMSTIQKGIQQVKTNTSGIMTSLLGNKTDALKHSIALNKEKISDAFKKINEKTQKLPGKFQEKMKKLGQTKNPSPEKSENIKKQETEKPAEEEHKSFKR